VSIMRDDRLLALHDLVAACRASAQHARLAAEVLSDDPRAKQLQALAAQRERVADTFSQPIIEADDIPAGPPEERGLLETALARARAAFDEDGGASLLEDCRAREQAVLRCAEAAAEAPLRNREKTTARELAADARTWIDGLSNT